MKSVLLWIESLEPGNFHRGLYNGFLQNGFIKDKKLNVIPLVCPRDVSFDWSVYNELLLKAVDKYKVDACFILYGEQISSNTLDSIKKKGIRLVNWQVDDPYMLTQPIFQNVRNNLKYYDKVLSTNKESLKNNYPQNGISKDKLGFMPFGYDDMFHCDTNTNKRYNVSFVGSAFQDRLKYINCLRNKLSLFGCSHVFWNNKGRISHSDMVKVVNQSKINLNFADQPVNHVLCLKNRVMEILGCGQFLMTERFPELNDLFKEDHDLVAFSDPGELDRKINFYLNNDIAREKIAKQGALSVKKYSYGNLIANILPILFE